MKKFLQSLGRQNFGRTAPSLRRRSQTSYRPTLESLEDLVMPTLIASEVLPLLNNGQVGGTPAQLAPTSTTVSVIAPALTASAPGDQTITLRAAVGGGGGGTPTGGYVNFNLGIFGMANNVAVVNGVAQTTFTIAQGTATNDTFTVSASYSGNTGFSASTSSGTSNGIIYFCQEGASTLLGSTLQTFAVLAGSTVTNTGATSIIGNVGVSPGTSVTGLSGGPGSVAGGTIHIDDGPAQTAQTELIAAYDSIVTEPYTFDLTGTDLGGLVLTPGVYHFDTSAQLTGTLTLDNQGDPTARFYFQIGSTLTTASDSRILIINGGPDNVYWQVGSSATLGTGTVFAGNILALTDITLNTTASIACGRALARNGAVTLDTNFIDPPSHSLTDDHIQAFTLSELREDHGFHYLGQYYQNAHGYNEKWFTDRNNDWYALTPDGDLIKWDGVSFATSQVAPVAHLQARVFADPTLLFNAQVALSSATLSQLTNLRETNGFHSLGTDYQNAHGYNEKWFIDRNNNWFALTPNGDLIKWDGLSFATSMIAPVAQVNSLVYDDPNQLFNASVTLPSSTLQLLSQLELANGFHSLGTSYQNAHGYNEKWFMDQNNNWYALIANGDLIKWDGVSFATSKLIPVANLGSLVFDDLTLLFNA